MAPACWALCSNSDHVKHSAVSMKYPNLYSFVCLFLGEALPATSHPRRKGLGKSEHNSSSTARCNHNETSFIHMKLLSAVTSSTVPSKSQNTAQLFKLH